VSFDHHFQQIKVQHNYTSREFTENIKRISLRFLQIKHFKTF